MSSPSLPAGTCAGQLEQLRLGVGAEVGRQRLAGPAQHGAAVVDRAADDPAPRRQRVAEHPPLRDRPRGARPSAAARRWCRSSRRPRRGAPRRGRGWPAARRRRRRSRASPASSPRSAAGAAPSSSRCVVGHERRQRARRRCPRSRAPRGPSRARAGSSRPVPDAIEWSTAHVPVSRATTSSLIPAQRRTAAKVSGSCSANHTSLGSGDIGCSGVPVRSCSSGCSARRRSACSVARMSPHVTSGVSARPPRVEADERVHGAAERQRGDPGALVARAGRGGADGRERAVDHDGGILHGLAGLGLEQRVRRLAAAQLAAVGVEGDRLGAGRPDVDAEDDGRRAVHAAKHASRGLRVSRWRDGGR